MRCPSFSAEGNNVALLLVLLAAVTPSFALSPFSSSGRVVAADVLRVDDGVLSGRQCRQLAGFVARCEAESGRESATTVWDRSLHVEPRSAMEAAMGTYLDAVGCDAGSYVEYWTRGSWVDVEAHRDLDEAFFEFDAVQRSPAVAHVLYLSVGDGVKGPTCVFTNDDGVLEIAVVPAVQGRVLRFDGDALHAVPKPTATWVIGVGEEQDEDDDDEEDEDEEEDEEEDVRSVLLFNVWREPPAEVSDRPLGLEPTFTDDFTVLSGGVEEVEEVEEEDLIACDCAPAEQWRSAVLANPLEQDDGEVVQLEVPLMGGRSRRRQNAKELVLIGSTGARDALHEPHKPTLLRLRRPPWDES